LKHPLFGVGPANFPDFSAVDSHEAGGRARWRMTHNTYLEWSSECGFPGVILFVSGVIFCLTRLSPMAKAYKENPNAIHLARIAGAIQFSILTYLFTSFFSSTAYEILFPTLSGLTMALLFAVENEKHTIPTAVPVAPALWAPPVRRPVRPAYPAPVQ